MAVTHISPKRLGDPGPSPQQKETILKAANAAPDHGRKGSMALY